MLTVYAQKDMGTTVEDDDTRTVHNNRKIDVDGRHTETIKKDTTVTVTDGKETNTVKQEIVITSQTAFIHITAPTEIQLLVGSSKLLMESDGSIELNGTNISINGSESVNIHGGSVTSKADQDHTTQGSVVLSDGAATNTVRGGMVLLNP
jgi:type VI secretion system secreted protein VgrG